MVQAHRQACAARDVLPAPSSGSEEAAETVVARLVASIVARAVAQDKGQPCCPENVSALYAVVLSVLPSLRLQRPKPCVGLNRGQRLEGRGGTAATAGEPHGAHGRGH